MFDLSLYMIELLIPTLPFLICLIIVVNICADLLWRDNK